MIFIYTLLAVFGGELVIYYLKKLVLSSKIMLSFDILGMIERILLVLVIYLGGLFMASIPFIIIIRMFLILGGSKYYPDIIKREEPAVEFQKIRLKNELAISLFASPSLGILFGIMAKFL